MTAHLLIDLFLILGTIDSLLAIKYGERGRRILLVPGIGFYFFLTRKNRAKDEK